MTRWITTSASYSTIALALVASYAPAQVVEVPTFEVAQPSIGQFIQGTDVAANPDGTILFAWGETAYEEGMRNAVLTRRYTAEGVPLGPAVRADASGYAHGPSIASDSRGGYIASWARMNDHCTWGDRGSTMCAAIGRRLDAAGQPVGSELLIHTWFAWPVGAGLPSGSVFFWESSGLWLSFYGANGEARGVSRVSGQYGTPHYFDIKPMPDGGFVTTWIQPFPAHASSGCVFGPDGQPRGPVFALGDNVAMSHVAVNPLGGFAVVGWYTDPTGQTSGSDPHRLHVWRFADDGSPLTNETLVYQGPPGVEIMFADAEFDPLGNLYVVWTDFDPNHRAGPNMLYPPKARAFDANGTPFGPAVEISDVAGVGVSTALLANGSLVNVWRGPDPSAPTYNQVYGNVVRLCEPGTPGCDATPPPTWTPRPTSTPTAPPSPTPTPWCGDARSDAGEQCDDGNRDDGDGCQADCTLTPRHDSVMVPVDPIKITIPAGQDEVTKVVPLQVRNADVEPKPERPGHVIQLVASDGDCPPGTIEGKPDFERGEPGDQDSILVMGGVPRTAQVIVKVSRQSFPDLDKKVPQRCTLRFTAEALIDGNIDPTPENNTVTAELNVVAASGGPNALASEEPVPLPPGFFVVSARPLKVRMNAGTATLLKKMDVVVSTGDGARDLPPQTIAIATADGDCPAGTVSAADFNARLEGVQSEVTLAAGRMGRGKLPVTLTASGFTAANSKSPARCTALITTTQTGAPEASAHTTQLLIEVTDYNDF